MADDKRLEAIPVLEIHLAFRDLGLVRELAFSVQFDLDDMVGGIDDRDNAELRSMESVVKAGAKHNQI